MATAPTGRLPGVTYLGELWGQRSWSEKDVPELLRVRLSFLHIAGHAGTHMHVHRACMLHMPHT